MSASALHMPAAFSPIDRRVAIGAFLRSFFDVFLSFFFILVFLCYACYKTFVFIAIDTLMGHETLTFSASRPWLLTANTDLATTSDSSFLLFTRLGSSLILFFAKELVARRTIKYSI